MTRPGQRVSKRAAHKAAVAARKAANLPTVKRTKQRRNPTPFPTEWFEGVKETEREGVLVTRINRKPPTYKCETVDSNGLQVVTGLKKSAPPLRGYEVLLPKGESIYCKTKRAALRFIASLETEVHEPTPEEDLPERQKVAVSE